MQLSNKNFNFRSFCTKKWISFCNCFAGGIFLATCLLGLIPHTMMVEKELLNILLEPNTTSHFEAKKTWTEILMNTHLIMLIGFLIMLLMENVINFKFYLNAIF